MIAPALPVRTLNDLRPGEAAFIRGLETGSDLRLRLLELGFVPGGQLQVIRRAPFGCPLEVDLDGVRYCLRQEQARAVLVERGS